VIYIPFLFSPHTHRYLFATLRSRSLERYILPMSQSIVQFLGGTCFYSQLLLVLTCIYARPRSPDTAPPSLAKARVTTRSLASRGIPRLPHLFNSSLRQTFQHIYHGSFYLFCHSHSHQQPLLRLCLAACLAPSRQKLFYLPLGLSMTLRPVVCLFHFRSATLVAHPSRPALQQPIY
jgi:hypothetical protein